MTNKDWAYQRLCSMNEIAYINASRLGPKLLKGFGYPDEVFRDAQDALALSIVLLQVTVLNELRDHMKQCFGCRERGLCEEAEELLEVGCDSLP